MRYRRFGQLNFDVSALGFGCMRLPTRGKPDDIDEPAAIEMIRYAIDHGVNYVDTAYPYHGGNSEKVVGRALAGGYRQKVALATKMPVWSVEKTSDLDRLFNEQLERLQTSRIDFYLLHNLTASFWARMREVGAIAWLQRMRQRGQIGHIGFSFHDKLEVFKRIIDEFSGCEFCQIQYNYVCEDVQAGTPGLRYAAERHVPVVIMEPLFGGTLANPPQPIKAIWDAAPGKPDPITMAFRWLWDKPAIATVLSGMTTLEHVKHNVRAAAEFGDARLSRAELELLARIGDKYKRLHPIPCTQCGYCIPCPHGVAIPDNFDVYNKGVVLGGNALALSRALYNLMPAATRADKCETCRECEAKCPQQIPISEWMPKVHRELTAVG